AGSTTTLLRFPLRMTTLGSGNMELASLRLSYRLGSNVRVRITPVSTIPRSSRRSCYGFVEPRMAFRIWGRALTRQTISADFSLFQRHEVPRRSRTTRQSLIKLPNGTLNKHGKNFRWPACAASLRFRSPNFRRGWRQPRLVLQRVKNGEWQQNDGQRRRREGAFDRA